MRYYVKEQTAMNCFEKMLLNYLLSSKIKMEITGFDMDGFEKATQEESKRRLELIEQIVFEDSVKKSDTEKLKAIKLCFERDFYS